MEHSRFSKLHPVVCFAFFLTAMGLGMALRHPAYVAASVVGAMALDLSLLGKKALRNLGMILPVFLLIAFLNPLFNTLGQRVLFTCFGRPYTWEALCYGMSLGGIFLAILLWFSCYNTVMTEDKFTYLFGNLAPSLALLLTMVFRLIPSLTKKAGQIQNARRCIGMGAGESDGVKERVRDGMTTLSALSSWALDGSVVTADSMNSRGYGTGKRVCFSHYRFTAADGFSTGILLLLGALAVWRVAAGSAAADFTPVMVIAPVDWGVVCYLLLLLFPTMLNWKEDIVWRISRSKI